MTTTTTAAALARIESAYVESAEHAADYAQRQLTETIEKGTTSTWVYTKLADTFAEQKELARRWRGLFTKWTEAEPADMAELLTLIDSTIAGLTGNVLGSAQYVKTEDDALKLRVEAKVLHGMGRARSYALENGEVA